VQRVPSICVAGFAGTNSDLKKSGAARPDDSIILDAGLLYHWPKFILWCAQLLLQHCHNRLTPVVPDL
jgi:hypothetical protein